MSYDNTNPRHVALRLSQGQESVLLGLDDKPSILGCAEATAARMTKATKRRPALVTRVTHDGQSAFVLNAMGASVQVQLRAMAAQL